MRNAAVPIAGNRFVIVGGASLVGSATAAELLDHGAAEVALFDNFAFGSEAAIAHLKDHPRLKLVRGDVMRMADLLRATGRRAGVLQLAAYMTLSMDRDPWGGLDVNIRGVQNALEACRANRRGEGGLRLLQRHLWLRAGREGRTGREHALPQPSARRPPPSCTAPARSSASSSAATAFRKTGQDYVVLRYSTVYGERQHYRAANALYIIETLDKVKRGEPPQVLRRWLARPSTSSMSATSRAPTAWRFESGGDRCRGQHLRPRAGHHAGAGGAGDRSWRAAGRQPEIRRQRAGQGAADLAAAPSASRMRRPSGAIGWRPQVDMGKGCAG